MEQFETINKVIKSVCDVAFGKNDEMKIKEEAIFKLFGNQYASL